MSIQDPMLRLRHKLVLNYPIPALARGVLEPSGIDLGSLNFSDAPEFFWRRVFDECLLQGPPALESVLTELLEVHPHWKEAELLLQRLARGEPDAPEAAEGGGSLTETIARNPLEGTELLLAFAEARGTQTVIIIQLQRCRQILEEIQKERRQHGRTLVHEARWKQTLREVLDLAHQLEDSH